MRNIEKKLLLINTGLISIVFLFIDTSASFYFIMGAICSVLMFIRTERTVNQFLSARSEKNTLIYLSFAFKYALMAIGMILSCRFGKVLGLCCFALGLSMVKLVLILGTFVGRKEER